MTPYSNMFDPKKVKKAFPIFQQKSNKNLVYLDNAATSQKPQSVLDAMTYYYQQSNANVGRGVYQLANNSTVIYGQARKKIANFFKADSSELILTRNSTEAINGVAYGWADHNLQKDDVILISLMEHHANLVVWQEAARRNQAKLEYAHLTAEGELDLKELEQKLKSLPVKLLALTHVSNTLGTRVSVPEIVKLVQKHSKKTRVLIDGAQSAPHLPIDFKKLNIDFFVFSGHKMLGPMGIGGLLVRQQILKSKEMWPWLFGGGMIDKVTKQKTKFNQDLAERFLAGTPDVANAVGLAAACDYLDKLDMKFVLQHEQDLVRYTLQQLSQLKEIEVIGPTKSRIGSVTFMHQQTHPHDVVQVLDNEGVAQVLNNEGVAQVLDNEGVAVRSGYHCCIPIHQHYDWPATIRVSFSVYNTKDDIDCLINALKKVKNILS
ncbi:MAG: aminotransferase class V-fold PLP-dependent enzyme [Patescibacteria group bacterium]|nr:aminotransferase class V-fold PLP-dependent enzyme [Patescibacteria group bacterium]